MPNDATSKPQHLVTILLGNEPWSIGEGYLQALRTELQLSASARGIDAALLGLPTAHAATDAGLPYAVDAEGLARLEVSGPLLPRDDLLSQLIGAVSTYRLTNTFRALRADPAVKSVVVVWDSYGGSLQGIPAAAAALRDLAAEKPTVSHVQGAMAAAAYWVGSAAGQVLLEGATDVVGGIGVLSRITWDAPAARSLELVRGKYKRASVDGRRPSADYMADAERRLDYLFTELVDAVAAHRGTKPEAALARWADGRMMEGRRAVAAGLADGMTTFGDLRASMQRDPARFKLSKGTRAQNRVRDGAAAPNRAAPAVVAPVQRVTARHGAAAVQTLAQMRARDLSGRITALQARGAAAGRPITVLQAVAQLRREDGAPATTRVMSGQPATAR